MEKVKYNDEYVYVDDSPLDKKEIGKIINSYEHEDELDDTCEFKTISNTDILANTITDIWGNKDE